ncbi:MAG: tetratricopeptide repeat protein [Caldilineaceae bacterium]|nr:tetratricopeptide repeat protein [Caldilineaceae bacterium]
MPDARRLRYLAQMRKEISPRLTQARAAALLGLEGRQSRQTLGLWENGEAVPATRHRRRFIGYLWDVLGLRRAPAEFERVWAILVEEWRWDPITDAEWRSFTGVIRPAAPGHAQAPGDLASGLAAAPIPVPPPPAQPPFARMLIGRSEELQVAGAQLAVEQCAVITGMAGAGKSALAAALVQAIVPQPRAVFWHTFRHGQDVHTLLWQLAAFLAWHGRDELWTQLQHARIAGEQLPPVETLAGYVLHLLQGEPYLLCLDDLHCVAADAQIAYVAEQLMRLLPGSPLRLICTARHTPTFARAWHALSLRGLSARHVPEFLLERGLVLPPDQVAQLHYLTGGNIQFLTLAAHALGRAREPGELLDNLAACENVESYLLAEVDERLTEEERSVMVAVALLSDDPATRDAIEAAVALKAPGRVLRRLQNGHLLASERAGTERTYRQHPLVEQFYREMASSRVRRDLHRRAARHYAGRRGQRLLAALHYRHAGEAKQAVLQLVGDPSPFISPAEAPKVDALLADCERADYAPLEWAAVAIARGQVAAMLGRREQAMERYADAMETVDGDQGDPARLLWARACRLTGELWELEDPQQALGWYQRALAEGDRNPHEFAALQIRIGTVRMYLAQYEEAIQALRLGLSRLSPALAYLRCSALKNLGAVYMNLGRMADAFEYTWEALDLSQQLGDDLERANIIMNLGILTYVTGDWQGAMARFEEVIRMAGELGNEPLLASAEFNLGAACINTGDHDRAHELLYASLPLARHHGLRLLELPILFRIAELKIRMGEWTEAAETLSVAHSLAVELDASGALISIERARAEIALGMDDAYAALEFACQSVARAGKLDEQMERGESLRVLAQVRLQLKQLPQALETCLQSLEILEDHDPYESARTRMVLAQIMLASGEPDYGRAHLRAAAELFARLGAERDLAQVHRLDSDPA